ncbi:hypothetical protein HO133_009570 [Letharia lupina]|uniref:Uncharacterized protein n=1 Tax=Letharia lupina TaxID=560253 RepID=A0A8H6CKZ7_9LECA|nr:uncharacterized protein HO133_009570 [Letharia lupina]KAF6225570.1 hypothetical protein HO133_009570 [Letharia lupina]
MDASPLTLAQTHARKASKANTHTAAIDEHDLAAGQFATAAKGTDNSEAFRTLKLLEQHHKKLAQLLKFRNSHPITANPEAIPDSKPAPQQPSSPVPAPAQDVSPYRPASQSLPAAHRPPRDISSSIASNLASARGIPSNKQRRNGSGQASSPVLAHQNAEGRVFTPPRRSKLGEAASRTTASPTTEKAPMMPEALSTKDSSAAVTISQEPAPSKTDEPFQRFYSTFEALFSKLSAPLAFAGLPLTSDLPQPADSAQSTKQTSKPSDRATAEPEYSRLFSKAALGAIRDEPGNTNLGAAESFYVVPVTGGTMPYASILARDRHNFPTLERDGTRNSEEMDEFVDARETPGPPSPLMMRTGKTGAKVAGSNKTMEELQLENEGLRLSLDSVTRRLYEFEAGAQASSFALYQSIKASMKQSPAASQAGTGVNVEGLEEQIREAKTEMERMGSENEKLKGVVGRYRERWEKLKEGARVRREGGPKEEGD